MNQTTMVIRLGASLLLASAACGTSLAADFPPRKPGLWQVDMTMPGGPMPPQQMKMCIDVNTDAEMQRMGTDASQGICSKPDIARNGDTVTINSVCKMGTTQASTHAVSHFTGDTAYHTDVTTTFNPPMAGHAQQVMAQDAQWVSQCPADMKPGDVVIGNGMKMNMKQMMGGARQ